MFFVCLRLSAQLGKSPIDAGHWIEHIPAAL
jgi:hypothetical protein